MKKLFIAMVALATSTAFYAFMPTQKATPIAYNVVGETSKVDFSGSKKEGYHPGYFKVKEGNVMVAAGKIVGGKFTIDIANLKVTDESGEKLEGHLKAPDFFASEKYADATYEIKTVTYTSATNASISGNLSIKGLNVPVKFNAIVRSVDDKKLFAEAFFSIDRTKLGMTYGKGMISNDVQIGVHLYAAK
jgi:polyisoprenoid-binding protein YceI